MVVDQQHPGRFALLDHLPQPLVGGQFDEQIELLERKQLVKVLGDKKPPLFGISKPDRLGVRVGHPQDGRSVVIQIVTEDGLQKRLASLAPTDNGDVGLFNIFDHFPSPLDSLHGLRKIGVP